MESGNAKRLKDLNGGSVDFKKIDGWGTKQLKKWLFTV